MAAISLTGVGHRYIDEAAELLDRILVIDHGRLVLDALTDDLRGSGAIVTGPAGNHDRLDHAERETA